MATVNLNHLYKTYDNGISAVKDIHLAIEDNEFIVIVGPSGCGKSTILRMIAGLEDVTSGEVKINGKEVQSLAPKDRSIAMVFQDYALYPHMTVYNNLAFGLNYHRVSNIAKENIVLSVAKTLALEPYLKKKPHELSGGQKQRVALGRAMVKAAHVFLLDEPLSHLDTSLRVKMRAELIHLQKNMQSTFIYVTHDQTEAMTMATRIVVMKDGEIQQVGTPKDIYHSPTNMFVAGFIGSPTINFLKGKLKTDNVYVGDTAIPIPKEKQSLLHPYNEKEVILGIRPEHINIKNSDSTLTVQVERTEWLGAETIFYVRIASQPLTVRTQNVVTEKQTVSLSLSIQHAHFFDPITEKRIQKKI